MITAETEYWIIFSEHVKKIVQFYITMELLVFLLVKGVKRISSMQKNLK